MKVVAGLFIALYLLVVLKSCDDCSKRGGTLVQGMFWYECVNKR